MTEPTDLDPQPVESRRGRASASPAVGSARRVVATYLLLVEGAREVGARAGPQGELEALPNPFEEVRVPFGPEEYAQQLPSGPRVVAESGAQSADQRDLLPGRSGERRALDQVDHDVPVADPSDEPREPLEATVERGHELAVAGREQLLPDRKGVAQPTHLPVEFVEALCRRVRTGDDLVDRTGDLREEALEFLGQQGRADPRSRRPLRRTRPLRTGRPTDSKPSLSRKNLAHLY
jgi:hypothetical protein